ncbi:MAG: hypothetical protein ACYDAL_06070 [Candidatus Dormibacteraceae bacterium]
MSKFTVDSPLKWIAVIAVVAAAAVPLSLQLWPAPVGAATPPLSMLPLFITIAVIIPALSLGLGVAFMLFGKNLLSAAGVPTLSRGAFFSIGWLLINWWPHSNFHRVANGWTNIVLIDYFFHTTVIVASSVVAAFFLSVIRERRDAGEVHASARQAPPTTTV